MVDDRADDRKQLMWFHKWAALLDEHNRLQGAHAELKDAYVRALDVIRIQSAPVEKPGYECEDCIGMKEHGCFCMAMGAHQPGGPTHNT